MADDFYIPKGYEYLPTNDKNVKILATKNIIQKNDDTKVAGEMYSKRHAELLKNGFTRASVVNNSEIEEAKKELSGIEYFIEDVIVPARYTLKEFEIEGLKIIYIKN